jgi:hypothetical protein
MKIRTLIFVLLSLCSVACSSSEVEDALDLAQGLPRKDIDRSRMAINAFANDARFGSAGQQFREVRDELGISRVRILIQWNSGHHPDPASSPEWGFFDSILDALPANMRALLVVTGLPGWMSNSDNWIDGNPRTTFVERWVRPVVRRYGRKGNVEAIQIWNEPNMVENDENQVLGIANNPELYVEMAMRASAVVREIAPGLTIVGTATTAINQNFPSTLDYNRGMRDAGLDIYIDKWGMHYYGKQEERVLQGGGVRDFINGLSLPIWITESGEQGVNNQLAYGETIWPFLVDKMPSIERIYMYQFSEDSPADITYGLKTLDTAFPVSDLYVWFRDGDS